ncbi:MAG: hypothetical protein SFX73_15990 [Kofleriaceae bacterium]|nr:hypothetical protein [Kofleriaceae bacterium]
MFRFATLLALAVLAFAGCRKDPQPTAGTHELPPLPPASGTPIGYLIDNASQLSLREEQITKLQEIDNSLAIRNEAIETQLREIEKPEPDAPQDPKAPPERRNMAPGAQPMKTTADAGKLHEAHALNNKDALEKAFAVLDDDQKIAAKKLLADRGIVSPGSARTAPQSEGGVPVEP